jgi:hypothetical protein
VGCAQKMHFAEGPQCFAGFERKAASLRYVDGKCLLRKDRSSSEEDRS